MRRRVAALFSTSVLSAALLACGGGPQQETRVAPRQVLEAERYRSADGLLASAALQAVVDMQVARDGNGLVAALADPDSLVRARAAFALASVQDSTAVPALIPLLDDPSPRVRADAAFALGQTPSARGAAALLGRIRVERDTTALLTQIDALGRAGGARQLEGLVGAELVEPHGDARLATALSLAYARFGMRGEHDPLAIQWLLSALTADAPAVRENAAYFFARSTNPAAWAVSRRWLVRALDSYGTTDRAAMHLLLALARLEDEDDVPRFREWLHGSPDWAIRANAVRALGRRGDAPEARIELVAALRDSSHHVRATAAAALAAVPLQPAEVDSLITLLPELEAEPPAFGPLLLAIAAGGAEQWALRRWLSLEDPELRRHASPALARVPGVAAFDALERAARTGSPLLSAAAVEALARRRELAHEDDYALGRYYTAFADALRRGELPVVWAAARALADSTFEPLGAGPLLQSVYLQMEAPADLEAMVEIVRALGALRDPTAVPLLREARVGAWPELGRAAAESLTRITAEPEILSPPADAPSGPMQWAWLAQWGSAPLLLLETERGTVVLELSIEQAPFTAQTVLTLATEGAYDGVPFHRVVPNFVAQGGDVGRRDGWGGPGYSIRSEFTRIPFLRGAAGMASTGKDTEGSQYFVVHSMQPHLDGRYTAFATVVDGLAVLDALREGDLVLRATPRATR